MPLDVVKCVANRLLSGARGSAREVQRPRSLAIVDTCELQDKPAYS